MSRRPKTAPSRAQAAPRRPRTAPKPAPAGPAASAARPASPAAGLSEQLAEELAVSEALESFIARLEKKERSLSAEATPSESGRYSYVPLSRPVFMRILFAVKRLLGADFERRVPCAHCFSEVTLRKSFLDVGCGLADKVILANHAGFEAHGLEVDPYLLETIQARHAFLECRTDRYRRPTGPAALSNEVMTLYPADALRFRYGEFDVVYFYRPFSDLKKQAQLERRIFRQVKPGALVVALSGVTDPPDTCEELKNFGEIDIAATIRIFRRRAKAPRAVRRSGSRAGAEGLSWPRSRSRLTSPAGRRAPPPAS